MNDNEEVQTLGYVRIAGLVACLAAVASGIGDIFYQGVSDGSYAADMEFI